MVVGIATSGRSEILRYVISNIEAQTRPAELIIIAASSSSDVPADIVNSDRFLVIFNKGGLTAKRNSILIHSSDADIICFFDDDFVPAPNYLMNVQNSFMTDEKLAGLTGLVIADGIHGSGIGIEESMRIIAEYVPNKRNFYRNVYSLYGCNMSFRYSVIQSAGIVFDEDLPLYGWLEDLEFSQQISKFGSLRLTSHAFGIHLGVKKGRQSGRKFGYSQISNPIFIACKGNMSWNKAFSQIFRNLLKNAVLSLLPQTNVDRRGRLFGNWLAVCDLFSGRLHPLNIISQ